MKVLVALCVLTIAAVAHGTSRGCRYDPWGKCVSQCEEGTHSYATGCGKLTPEATCDEPNPVESEGSICDYSSCYCDPPTVRDTVSKKCVPLDECPKKA